MSAVFGFYGSMRTHAMEVIPVAAFDQNHPLVGNPGPCGNVSPGDAVPATMTCSSPAYPEGTVSGGVAWYSYGNPDGHSMNAGVSVPNAAVISMVATDAGEYYMNLVFDVPNDDSGGNVHMTIDSPSLAGKSVDIVLEDDPSSDTDCSDDGDCYNWNEATGVGTFAWEWSTCCTDGMVMGPMPESFSMDAQIRVTHGVERVLVASVQTDGTVSYQELVESGGVITFSFTAQSCAEECAAITSCGLCSANSRCSWCEESGCLATNDSPTCASDLVSQGCCPADSCSCQASLDECSWTAGCAWCYDTGTCVTGSPLGPCTDCNDWRYDPVPDTGDRPFCDGAVDAQGVTVWPTWQPVSQWCSAKGNCTGGPDEFVCDCQDGYAGAGCQHECPSTGAGICNGHGTCSNVAGTCACDCGWSGTDCSVSTDCTQGTSGADTVCYTGATCDATCGKLLPGGSWTGHGDGDGGCTCMHGWVGDDCLTPCPGINPDGTGAVCSAAGYFDVALDRCVCNACHDLIGATCVEQADPVCDNGGAPACDAGTKTKVCDCLGAWGGPTCAVCQVENQDKGARCSAVTGEPVCPVGYTGYRCSASLGPAPAPIITHNTSSTVTAPTGAAYSLPINFNVEFGVGVSAGTKIIVSVLHGLSLEAHIDCVGLNLTTEHSYAGVATGPVSYLQNIVYNLGDVVGATGSFTAGRSFMVNVILREVSNPVPERSGVHFVVLNDGDALTESQLVVNMAGYIPPPSASPTVSVSATATVTSSPTPSVTPSISESATGTPSLTASVTGSATESATGSATASITASVTGSETPSASPSATASTSSGASASVTPSNSPTASETSSTSPSGSASPSGSTTSAPSSSSAPSASPTPEAACPPLVPPSNGFVSCNTTSECVIECAVGFVRTSGGPEPFMCVAGNWTGGPATQTVCGTEGGTSAIERLQLLQAEGCLEKDHPWWFDVELVTHSLSYSAVWIASMLVGGLVVGSALYGAVRAHVQYGGIKAALTTPVYQTEYRLTGSWGACAFFVWTCLDVLFRLAAVSPTAIGFPAVAFTNSLLLNVPYAVLLIMLMVIVGALLAVHLIGRSTVARPGRTAIAPKASTSSASSVLPSTIGGGGDKPSVQAWPDGGRASPVSSPRRSPTPLGSPRGSPRASDASGWSTSTRKQRATARCCGSAYSRSVFESAGRALFGPLFLPAMYVLLTPWACHYAGVDPNDNSQEAYFVTSDCEPSSQCWHGPHLAFIVASALGLAFVTFFGVSLTRPHFIRAIWPALTYGIPHLAAITLPVRLTVAWSAKLLVFASPCSSVMVTTAANVALLGAAIAFTLGNTISMSRPLRMFFVGSNAVVAAVSVVASLVFPTNGDDDTTCPGPVVWLTAAILGIVAAAMLVAYALIPLHKRDDGNTVKSLSQTDASGSSKGDTTTGGGMSPEGKSMMSESDGEADDRVRSRDGASTTRSPGSRSMGGFKRSLQSLLKRGRSGASQTDAPLGRKEGANLLDSGSESDGYSSAGSVGHDGEALMDLSPRLVAMKSVHGVGTGHQRSSPDGDVTSVSTGRDSRHWDKDASDAASYSTSSRPSSAETEEAAGKRSSGKKSSGPRRSVVLTELDEDFDVDHGAAQPRAAAARSGVTSTPRIVTANLWQPRPGDKAARVAKVKAAGINTHVARHSAATVPISPDAASLGPMSYAGSTVFDKSPKQDHHANKFSSSLRSEGGASGIPVRGAARGTKESTTRGATSTSMYGGADDYEVPHSVTMAASVTTEHCSASMVGPVPSMVGDPDVLPTRSELGGHRARKDLMTTGDIKSRLKDKVPAGRAQTKESILAGLPVVDEVDTVDTHSKTRSSVATSRASTTKTESIISDEYPHLREFIERGTLRRAATSAEMRHVHSHGVRVSRTDSPSSLWHNESSGHTRASVAESAVSGVSDATSSVSDAFIDKSKLRILRTNISKDKVAVTPRGARSGARTSAASGTSSALRSSASFSVGQSKHKSRF